MSSVPVVVVIVGVVIAAITAATLSNGPKPATPPADPERTPAPPDDPELFEPAFPRAEPAPTATFDPPPFAPQPLTGDPVPPRRRLRALALLGVSVVALGSVTAGLIGGFVLLGARLLDQALG